jgi:uncharacterized protein
MHPLSDCNFEPSTQQVEAVLGSDAMNAKLLITMFAGLFFGCAPSRTLVSAAGPTGNAPQGIAVTGYGEAAGPPSIARVNVGVETRAVDAATAIAEANTRMRAVIAALGKAGIAAADLQTSNLSLNFERTSQEMPPAPPLPLPAPMPPGKSGATGGRGVEAAPAKPEQVPHSLPEGFYRASNTVSVTIRDLGRIGEVLGAATTAGADQMYGIEFKIEDPSALETRAREKAVADAKDRASRLAALNGVKLGRALSIVENPGSRPQPTYGYEFREAAMSKVPVEQGSLVVSTSVQVIYELSN